MSLLSEEQYNEFVSKLDEATTEVGEESEVEAEVQSLAEEKSDDSEDSKTVEDDSSDDTEDVKEEVETQAESSEEEEAPSTPEHIPYSRFKEVNDKFRSRESELEEARTRIQQLEQLTLNQAQQPPAAPAQPAPSDDEAWLQEVFGEDAGDKSAQAIGALREELTAMKSWQQQRSEQLVAAQLEAEIKAAVGENPDVKPEELWQAVASDGTVNVSERAAAVQAERSSLREQYKTESQTELEELRAKLDVAEKAAAEANAFKRPSGRSTAPPAEKGGPRTVAEATNAFAEALRERMSL